MKGQAELYKKWLKTRTTLAPASKAQVFGAAFELGLKSSASLNVADRFFQEAERLVEQYPYLHVEVARTQPSAWMAWVCTHGSLTNPVNKVLVSQQGSSFTEACQNGIEALLLLGIQPKHDQKTRA